MNILLLGNPNVGKTSLFNHLTGQRARVGNYPGVTVERRFADISVKARDGSSLQVALSDVPGTYSLCARSPEEQIAILATLGLAGHPAPDVVIAVVNAAQLGRNLYLVGQLLEMRVPTVVALNMMDEAGDAAPDPQKLSECLGVSCVSTNGETGAGLPELLQAAVEQGRQPAAFRPRFSPHYASAVVAAADRVAQHLPSAFQGSVERSRALSFWALMSVDEEAELSDVPPELAEAVSKERRRLDFDLEITSARYEAIDELVKRVLGELRAASPLKFSERIDRVLLHPLWGFLAFFLAMLLVFQALFSWADPAISLVETFVTGLQTWLSSLLPAGIFQELVVDGVVGGVGNVVVFLPQILLLFFFIGLLEDSGYMARAAYLMDRVMRSMGLHGRAFVPMLSGFACAIPAIMATRTLESRRDQLLTMMVVPLMTCSARLPVYTLIIAALFPVSITSGWPVQGLLMVGLYLFSILTALLAAWVLSKTVIKGRSVPLILELPPYRLPRLAPTLRMMQLRGGQFLHEAGTVILVATIFLWALLSFPRAQGEPSVDSTRPSTAPALEASYAGRLGKALEPAMEPVGFDWKITTGIIGAFAAREVFVSSLGLVFGLEDLDDDALPLRERIAGEKNAQGGQKYTPLVGLSLLLFFALACQCMSTLAVVRRETRSYRWPAFLFVYMTSLAYGTSLLVYQTGRALGFS